MRDKTIFSLVTAVIFAVAAAVPLGVAAYDFEVGGIYYSFNDSHTEATVTYKAYKTATYQGTVAIPERENPRCRLSHMPKRYWNHLTERQEQSFPA